MRAGRSSSSEPHAPGVSRRHQVRSRRLAFGRFGTPNPTRRAPSASPRRLKRRNPSTCLIQPCGASDSHLRSAYAARPAGVDSFSDPMRPQSRDSSPGRGAAPSSPPGPTTNISRRCTRVSRSARSRSLLYPAFRQHRLRLLADRLHHLVEQQSAARPGRSTFAVTSVATTNWCSLRPPPPAQL